MAESSPILLSKQLRESESNIMIFWPNFKPRSQVIYKQYAAFLLIMWISSFKLSTLCNMCVYYNMPQLYIAKPQLALVKFKLSELYPSQLVPIKVIGKKIELRMLV